MVLFTYVKQSVHFDQQSTQTPFRALTTSTEKGIGKVPGSPIPENRRQAKKNPFWGAYHQAEIVEMKLHEENGTWRYVRMEDVPKDKLVLDTKWVYDDKIEIDDEGEPYITRLKARLTAMGNLQRKGIIRMYSPRL